mmetsp:Transcript_44553/g.144668  ORF Transcript_44553/g.144668 Transcript_44553/m.144668 type:complete len:240 (+) Transcript_44553:151-870(+)
MAAAGAAVGLAGGFAVRVERHPAGKEGDLEQVVCGDADGREAAESRERRQRGGGAEGERDEVGQRRDRDAHAGGAHARRHPLGGQGGLVGRTERLLQHKHVVHADAEQDEGEDSHDRVDFVADERREAVRHSHRQRARDEPRDGERGAGAARVKLEEDGEGVRADEDETDVNLDDVAADVAAQLALDGAGGIWIRVDQRRLPLDGDVVAVGGAAGERRVAGPLLSDQQVELVLPRRRSL